jgi:hypothetical protein
MDVQLLSSAAPLLRDAGVSRDQAQKLVPVITRAHERFVEQQHDEWRAMKTQWAREAIADREIGGTNWKETMRLSGLALSLNHLSKIPENADKDAVFTETTLVQ